MTDEPITSDRDPGSQKAGSATKGAAGRARSRSLRALAVAAALGLVSIAAFVFGLVGFATSIDQVEREPTASADGIVALTGGAQRIEDAVDLLARGYGTRLLITGVNARTSRQEIARLNPSQRALLDCCVDLDYRAQNTVGNAVETRRWARHNGFKSLIVVTSNYHMPRTMTELDRVLPDTRKASHSVVTPLIGPAGWWTSPTAMRVLASEYAKYLAASVRKRLVGPPAEDALAPGGVKVVAEPIAAR